jgi:hypothetical protein
MEDVPDLDAAMRAQRPERLRWMAVIAERQHGTVAHWQLHRLGFSASGIQRMVAAGRLHVLHRGVYAVGHRALPPRGWTMAAALAGGTGALVCCRSAAAVRGFLSDARAVVDVLVPAKRRNRKGIVFHESRQIHPDDRDEVDGIPVTSVARTLLEIAEVVPRRKLVYAIEKAEKQRVFDLTELRALMARSHGRHGLNALTAALTEIEPEAEYTHEGMERLFIPFCRRYQIPMPAMNVVVEGYTVDAYWREHNLIVELDSWEHHRTARAFEEDRRRDAALTPEVVRVTHRWLTKEPDDLARTLNRKLSASPSLAATA